MPFPFEEVCVLLSRLEDVATQHPPLLRTARLERNKEIVTGWFKSHRSKISQLDANGTAALLSTLLPEWRTDRVYGIQSPGLFRMLCRILNVSFSTRPILEAYKQPGSGDLGACLERAMNAGGAVAEPPVNLEEVDDALQMLAGGSIFSDPSIPRLPAGSSGVRDMMLGDLIKRMRPNQSKWFARLVLKDFASVQIDEDLILRSIHFLLPGVLLFHRDFNVAASMLKNELSEYHEHPDPRSQRLLRESAARHLKPRVGTKVGRPTFYKARSIDNCLRILGTKSWVLERKYDGEYCEIHVDLRWSQNPRDCIKIFSKSGKDSTKDRAGLIPTLVKSLRLGERDCRFKKQAILLGEMVVFSDKDDCVLPFEKIRKHVTRSGRRIGTDEDSQPHSHEHLAIVFFDLLLLDDEVVMTKSVEERRPWLREAYRKIHGRAMGSEWKTIEFNGSPEVKQKLVEQFTASIARRCEGLVVKPCEVPYFSLEGSAKDYSRSFIKLKKDYIDGLGDEADFAVIGASYNAQQAATSGIPGIKWTTFHLGCLTNQTDVRRAGARPVFKYVGTISQESCIPTPILEAANNLTTFGSKVYVRNSQPLNFDIQPDPKLSMEVALDTPFVFEVLGSGFEKPSNCNFLMLRHARVKKLHEDRSWEDCVTFEELQEQGAATRSDPVDSESQETRRWIERLTGSHKRKMAREASATPSSRRTSTPTGSSVSISQRPSPRRPGARRAQDATQTPVENSELPSSPLKGSRAIGQPPRSPKRSCEDLEEISAADFTRAKKKQRVETEPTSNRPVTTTLTFPLSEISTNTDAQLQRTVSRMTRRTKAVTNVAGKIMNFFQPTAGPSTPSCEGTNCAFSNTTIYLAPCITQTPYITDDLLGSHDTTITPALSHWDRDSFAHPVLTETVSESQSYAGMRKIILVEKGRRGVVQSVIQEIQRLNGGKFKERIEVYDWRVLEACQKHDQGANLLKMHFLGATLFDDTRERVIFVGEGG